MVIAPRDSVPGRGYCVISDPVTYHLPLPACREMNKQEVYLHVAMVFHGKGLGLDLESTTEQ